MYILGINCYHGDSSACLVKDGYLVAACEEERFKRIKHWAGFPKESIKYCLQEAHISFADINYVAVNQDLKANWFKKISYIILKRPSFDYISNKIKTKSKRSNIKTIINNQMNANIKANVSYIEHHLSHLASTFYVSPFKKASIVSVDGFGDFTSTMWGLGINEKINIDDKIIFPHSLGIFYEALTQWLGFENYGDEYKVMGLAPYGKTKYIESLRKIVKLKKNGKFELDLKFFKHHIDVNEGYSNDPSIRKKLYSKELEKLIGPSRKKYQKITQKHKDVARSVQFLYEEVFFKILNHVYQIHKSENLCLAGGCAMNSVANGKIYEKTPFKKVYVQSAAGDAGGALGAAFATWHKHGGKRVYEMNHAYLGPEFSSDYIKKLIIKNDLLKNDLKFTKIIYKDEKKLLKEIALKITEGKVVGWFQGRMEWGPRALGNRSILGDPRRQNMKDILNIKIKKRETFRPFAPSILEEDVGEWFEFTDHVPFMMQVYPIKKNKRSLIPAVTHIDGSGRLQTVSKLTNYRYYSLIKNFKEITGVPMLLNTSFNENEPVVCCPEEAINTFLRTKMDLIVLNNWVITRMENNN